MEAGETRDGPPIHPEGVPGPGAEQSADRDMPSRLAGPPTQLRGGPSACNGQGRSMLGRRVQFDRRGQFGGVPRRLASSNSEPWTKHNRQPHTTAPAPEGGSQQSS